jgi:hypothetical protein
LAQTHYHAIVSSDWNECLAPCGPFDCISFVYPELADDLTAVFRQYTGNDIPLSQASRKIQAMMPAPITPDQMDAYLESHFAVYRGVPDFIEWCHAGDILFMINTTGAIGYFQRILAKKLIPPIRMLSAHPGISYASEKSDPDHVLKLFEVQDKGPNTQQARRLMDMSSQKIILMGDSGGDGPHFQWGADRGAFLIGSMTKPSLKTYCRRQGIPIDLHFGLSYNAGEKKRLNDEMAVDFRELIPVVSELTGIS